MSQLFSEIFVLVDNLPESDTGRKVGEQSEPPLPGTIIWCCNNDILECAVLVL